MAILDSTLQRRPVGCGALGAWPGPCGGSPRPGVPGPWCVPLPTPRLTSLGTQRCHSGWECHQMCPWHAQHGQGMEVALEGEGGALVHGPWAHSSPPELRCPGWGAQEVGQGWGMSSSGAAPVWMVWWGWYLSGAATGGSASRNPARGAFFFPGKGYSLSLGAVVIAGGGSGLNFHADALRSRSLEHV